MGVEEEFHLVDLKTRRLTARAPELLAELSDSYVAELQRCVVEMNSSVVDTLEGLRADLQRHRRILVDAAAKLGIGVVAAGAVPLAVPAEMQVTQTPRYRQMLADYQLLAREQLICGTQVHVGIDDRDESVAVANRVAPFVPTLLALSASSPFWSDGSDTGYSSGRTLVWQRWPTTGLAAPVSSAAEYDQMVADLVGSGAIADEGMVYFDVRPAVVGADPRATGVRQLPIGRHDRADRRLVSCTGRTRGRAIVARGILPSRSPHRWAGRRCGALPAPGWKVTSSTSPGRGPACRGGRRPTWCALVRPQLEAAGDWDVVSELAAGC